MTSLNIYRFPLLLALLATLAAHVVRAQDNSVVVQTFTYGSSPSGAFVMPPLSERYEKVLMHYKLRCPFDAQCGEWDYLMYIYLFDHTGIIDSAPDTVANYRVNGASPDSLPFMRGPSWQYLPRFQYGVTRGNRTALDSAPVGVGTTEFGTPFNALQRSVRAQYVWRKAELTAAGLKPGPITGIRFDVVAPGSELRNLTIRMKGTTRDTVTPGYYDADGFTTVYRRDTRFTAAGWATLDFPTPYNWVADSNIVVDISFDNAAAGTGTSVRSTVIPGPSPSGIIAVGPRTARHFEGADHVEVPKRAFADLDSAITVAFWAYGNPKFQPQDQSIFEALNADGARVLNVHLPWSDKTVYWDAGGAGGYDRLSKATTKDNEYKGRWNYWTFTKNAKSGVMRIYLNGVSWSSTTGKKKRMTGIETFKIGAFGDGSHNYDGDVAEFAVWNTEVDAATIRAWMGRDLDATHPYSSKLRLYYKFNEAGLAAAVDSSGNGYDGRYFGVPAPRAVSGADIFGPFVKLPYRPNVVFEQGTYASSTVDTTVTVDSIAADPMSVVRFAVADGKAVATDTLTVWPANPRVTRFDRQGRVADSVRLAADSVFHLVRIPYDRKFERIDRYELGRYITPYGNGLNLGEGFTWTYDVSDFRPLLHDTVYLNAYNQQELVDMTFEFVKGTPPRDPISVTNLWNGGFPYGHGAGIESYLTPKRVKIPTNAANSRIRMTPTGHGFGGTENCAEFCPKEHGILVNNTSRYKRLVWRDNCNVNPVYPQGGTWVYSRTNWCPGAEVWTYEFELTPWVTPGDSVTLDYNVTPYTWNGQGSSPYYQIETQLVTYGAPNFTLDAALDAVKAPSTTDLYKRMNPICSNPVVVIRNTGSTPLTSLDIIYGIAGGPTRTFNWTGQLNFLETAEVKLGAIDWGGATSPTFLAAIANPNGGADEYANNNVKELPIKLPAVFPAKLIFELRTNLQPEENSYKLIDLATGRVVFERSELEPQTTYSDTLTLPDGCYEFRLEDLGGDGLNWWANPDAGAGSMRIRRGETGSTLRTYNNGDFGGEIYEQFTVGAPLISDAPSVPGAIETTSSMDVHPNPTSGEFVIDLRLARSASHGILSVTNMIGAEVYRRDLTNVTSGAYTVNLQGFPSGAYMVAVRAGEERISRKIVVR